MYKEQTMNDFETMPTTGNRSRDVLDRWLDTHPEVWVDDDARTRGWVTAYRDLIEQHGSLP